MFDTEEEKEKEERKEERREGGVTGMTSDTVCINTESYLFRVTKFVLM